MIPVLQLITFCVHADQAGLNALHHWIASDHTRMVFDLTAESDQQVFLLDNPPRMVIDFKNVRLSGPLDQPSNNHPLFSRVRSALRNEGDLRVVIDLKKSGTPRVSPVSGGKAKGHQLIVDFFPKGVDPDKASKPRMAKTVPASESVSAAVTKETEKPVKVESDSKKDFTSEKPVTVAAKEPTPAPVEKAASQAETLSVKNEVEAKEPLLQTKSAAERAGDIVIAIDAGHGGEDPGAHGPKGTHEKEVTLAIAKKLAGMINAKSGMKAVLVRKGDYYISLRERMNIARDANADLFVSIHADAFQQADVQGASVFTLSTAGASNEASRWLADQENAADLIGGVSLVDKDDVLAKVLLDLSQTATQEASVNAASTVLKSLKKAGQVHQNAVQKAEFLVLKSPDVPSILVEMAFISNPTEEERLKNSAHQDTLARAVFNGIDSYFKHFSPMETRVASTGSDNL
ncbi:N-acetylmuramoyl-L-alanine amidase [Methylicorpusculum oleiharenae]|uniref:N-acetylmuramoyl-L-alanine amidase n=1 Tax=Methylicorpusculum oleiharenae TaxID=1338687 RepID=UPI001E61C2C8|nr:N-acetylmuramoyl-L-alanine amidase [Methylicorpusculum oleiharenae]MCD2448945.1 N-acetylmuramoyl-L-alanine amidase [Methylicorpusculum oleiharenae]